MKKNYDKVFRTIAKLDLQEYSINQGGCGWFAYLVALHFPELRIYYKHPDDIKNLKKGNGTGCTHVLVSPDGKKFYDSNGLQDVSYIYAKSSLVKVTLEYLKISLETKNVWNTTFDKDKISIIEKKIKKVIQ